MAGNADVWLACMVSVLDTGIFHITVSYSALKILKLLLVLLITAHFHACLWYVIGVDGKQQQQQQVAIALDRSVRFWRQRVIAHMQPHTARSGARVGMPLPSPFTSGHPTGQQNKLDWESHQI